MRPGYTGGHQAKKILAVGITSTEGNQVIFEESLRLRLVDMGFVVELGKDVLPKDAASMDKAALRDLLVTRGFDAVVTMQLHSLRHEEKYVPPVYATHGFNTYYPMAVTMVTRPGYVKVSRVVSLEARLYLLDGQGIAWSSRSKTIDPDSITQYAKEYTDVMAKRLLSDGAIKR